jgi:hypothetical protein
MRSGSLSHNTYTYVYIHMHTHIEEEDQEGEMRSGSLSHSEVDADREDEEEVHTPTISEIDGQGKGDRRQSNGNRRQSDGEEDSSEELLLPNNKGGVRLSGHVHGGGDENIQSDRDGPVHSSADASLRSDKDHSVRKRIPQNHAVRVDEDALAESQSSQVFFPRLFPRECVHNESVYITILFFS